MLLGLLVILTSLFVLIMPVVCLIGFLIIYRNRKNRVIDNLNNDLGSYEKKMNQLEQALIDKNKELGLLAKEIELKNNKITNDTIIINKLNTVIGENNSKISFLESLNIGKGRYLIGNEYSAVWNNNIIENLNSLINTKKLELSQSVEQFNNVVEQYVELSDDCNKLITEFEDLSSRYDSSVIFIQELKAELGKTIDDYNTLINAYGYLQDAYNILRDDHNAQTIQYKHVCEKYTTLTNEYTTLYNEYEIIYYKYEKILNGQSIVEKAKNKIKDFIDNIVNKVTGVAHQSVDKLSTLAHNLADNPKLKSISEISGKLINKTSTMAHSSIEWGSDKMKKIGSIGVDFGTEMVLSTIKEKLSTGIDAIGDASKIINKLLGANRNLIPSNFNSINTMRDNFLKYPYYSKFFVKSG